MAIDKKHSVEIMLTIAKSLRTIFNDTARDLYRFHYSDERTVEKVREMHRRHGIFQEYCQAIKDKDEALYEAEILGVQSKTEEA